MATTGMVRLTPEQDGGPVTADIADSDVDVLEGRGWITEAKEALVEDALTLGVLGSNGEPAPRAVLERWSDCKLESAIDEMGP